MWLPCSIFPLLLLSFIHVQLCWVCHFGFWIFLIYFIFYFYLDYYFRALFFLNSRKCLWLPFLLQFTHFYFHSVLRDVVKDPSACIPCLNNFSFLLFFFIPPKPEGVEKETAQNFVLCAKGKALPPHSLHLFLCGWWGTCLEEENSAASTIF